MMKLNFIENIKKHNKFKLSSLSSFFNNKLHLIQLINIQKFTYSANSTNTKESEESTNTKESEESAKETKKESIFGKKEATNFVVDKVK